MNMRVILQWKVLLFLLLVQLLAISGQDTAARKSKPRPAQPQPTKRPEPVSDLLAVVKVGSKFYTYEPLYPASEKSTTKGVLYPVPGHILSQLNLPSSAFSGHAATAAAASKTSTSSKSAAVAVAAAAQEPSGYNYKRPASMPKYEHSEQSISSVSVLESESEGFEEKSVPNAVEVEVEPPPPPKPSKAPPAAGRKKVQKSPVPVMDRPQPNGYVYKKPKIPFSYPPPQAAAEAEYERSESEEDSEADVDSGDGAPLEELQSNSNEAADDEFEPDSMLAEQTYFPSMKLRQKSKSKPAPAPSSGVKSFIADQSSTFDEILDSSGIRDELEEGDEFTGFSSGRAKEKSSRSRPVIITNLPLPTPSTSNAHADEDDDGRLGTNSQLFNGNVRDLLNSRGRNSGGVDVRLHRAQKQKQPAESPGPELAKVLASHQFDKYALFVAQNERKPKAEADRSRQPEVDLAKVVYSRLQEQPLVIKGADIQVQVEAPAVPQIPITAVQTQILPYTIKEYTQKIYDPISSQLSFAPVFESIQPAVQLNSLANLEGLMAGYYPMAGGKQVVLNMNPLPLAPVVPDYYNYQHVNPVESNSNSNHLQPNFQREQLYARPEGDKIVPQAHAHAHQVKYNFLEPITKPDVTPALAIHQSTIVGNSNQLLTGPPSRFSAPKYESRPSPPAPAYALPSSFAGPKYESGSPYLQAAGSSISFRSAPVPRSAIRSHYNRNNVPLHSLRNSLQRVDRVQAQAGSEESSQIALSVPPPELRSLPSVPKMEMFRSSDAMQRRN